MSALFLSLVTLLFSLPAGAAEAGEMVYRPGAAYRFYSGTWSKDLDLDKIKPVVTGVINVGRDQDTIKPAAKGDGFVVVSGVIRVDQAGTYRYLPGLDDSAFNVMTVGGKVVSRRNLGDGVAEQTEVSLSAGHHPFEITFFKTSTPFSMTWDVGRSDRFSDMSAEHFWYRVPFQVETQTELLTAFAALGNHIKGKAELDAKQVEAHKLTLDKHRDLFGQNEAIIQAGFDLVSTYDKVHGPLWVAHDGWDTGHRRKPTPPAIDIHWTIFNVMQNIMDKVYTVGNIERFGSVLDGYKFGCSANFPGAVAAPADPDKVYRVKINADNPKTWGRDGIGYSREPTGAYVAPGTIATVTVPEALVGKGYMIRVGAHSWDHSGKRMVLRLYRSSLVYPVNTSVVRVASPLGGGIYFEVPELANDGVVEVAIRNAVRAPYFSAKSFHKTSLEEWRQVERKHQAPWADFQSDKFMMQVPTSWIYKLDDPATLMRKWDMSMDAMNDLMGLAHLQGKETMYLQVDVQNRARNFSTGYPTGNDRYDPKKEYDGNSDYYLVRGPEFAPNFVFHEKGHGYFCVKFAGEMESTVNLHHVAVWNRKLGFNLDEAFAASRGLQNNKHITLDNTAVTWMASSNFINDKPMSSGEKAYQVKGHAKYVDIVRLFGWECLGDFWKTYNVDVENGEFKGRRGYKNDEISLRLSKAAGVDLTPLLHFWGIPPEDAGAVKAAVAAGKLPSSAKIYDALEHYQSLVPKDNKAFREFALNWWGKQPSAKGFSTEREHAKQWQEFDGDTHTRIRKAAQDIMDSYFPNGRPDKG